MPDHLPLIAVLRSLITDLLFQATHGWAQPQKRTTTNTSILISVTTLQTEKNPTFPDEIADNTSNKCTLINTKTACYEVSVVFQQLAKVNSKC